MNFNAQSRLSRVPAVLGMIAATAALAACGSSDLPESGNSSSSGATSKAGSSDPGVATAKAAVAKYQQAPTKITVTTPLDAPPPKGKTVVMLGTADPNNVIIQKGVKEAGTTRWSPTTRPTRPRSARRSTRP